ncbi:MAG: hypothetical protein FWB96_01615 [Defluviitaleaceae bacterium]|nr:hypothetical protein [Defluviitaleaceae bacterium]MCL2261609.1 hypothetical protein [Defluviitaleaceae bacterium]
MTRYEFLTLLYLLDEILDDEDFEKANKKALKVIRKAIKEAESKQN